MPISCIYILRVLKKVYHNMLLLDSENDGRQVSELENDVSAATKQRRKKGTRSKSLAPSSYPTPTVSVHNNANKINPFSFVFPRLRQLHPLNTSLVCTGKHYLDSPKCETSEPVRQSWSGALIR